MLSSNVTGEGDEQDGHHAADEPLEAAIGPVAQLAVALEHAPAGAEQRVAEPEPGRLFGSFRRYRECNFSRQTQLPHSHRAKDVLA